jgi:hypothetical protein
LVNSTAFSVVEVLKDSLFELKKMWQYEKPEYRRDVFTVVVDRKNVQFQCECAKFEKDGILCCHILILFTQFDVTKIHDDYILKRWTVEFREQELLKQKDEVDNVQGSKTSESALRYALMMNSLNDVCADLSIDADKSKKFLEEVHKLHKISWEEIPLEKKMMETLLY